MTSTTFDLQPFNTFGVPARAEHLAAFGNVDELRQLLDQYGKPPTLLLGGGSNVLLLDEVPGLTLLNRIGGIEVRAEDDRYATVSAGAGVNWHELVVHTLDQGLGGLENLALIPGTLGAAPVQNIGAYGVELADIFVKLDALEWTTGRVHTFSAADCAFGYRDSFFKRNGRDRFCILRVDLRLTRQAHAINTSYGAIRETLGEQGVGPDPTPSAIARAVIHIRRSKLPDWRELGNAGSFFKNPVIDPDHFARLKQIDPKLPGYAQEEGTVKLPAGYLIDQCGWRGRREGRVGCYEKQALVIVNYGGATGREILAFGEKVAASVYERFGVRLEREVNAVGSGQ